MNTRPPLSPRRGLSLIELLISLSITTMLLTAVATSFSAASSVIRHNDEFFRASQAARVTLNHLLTEIRRCNAMDCDDPTAREIDLITHKDASVAYRYDPAAGVIKLITNDSLTDPDYVLCANVKEAKFTGLYDAPEDGAPAVVRVSVEIVVAVGDNEVRLSGSAAPRKAQTWR